jgi:hypothetical protein
VVDDLKIPDVVPLPGVGPEEPKKVLGNDVIYVGILQLERLACYCAQVVLLLVEDALCGLCGKFRRSPVRIVPCDAEALEYAKPAARGGVFQWFLRRVAYKELPVYALCGLHPLS